MSAGPHPIRDSAITLRVAILWAIVGLAASGGWGFLFNRYVAALERADLQAAEMNSKQGADLAETKTVFQAQVSALRETEAARDASNMSFRLEVIRRLDRIENAIERSRR